MDNFNSCEELDQAIYEQVTDLSECGNLLMEQGCYEEALLKFEFALSLLPSPQEKWDAFTWLKAATSDAYFFMKNLYASNISFTIKYFLNLPSKVCILTKSFLLTK